MTEWRLLVFGASGAIGGAVATHGAARGWSITGSGRGDPPAGTVAGGWRRYDPLADDGSIFADDAPFDGVCWAQGANMADSLQAFDAAAHLELYRANCLAVMSGMAMLVGRGLLRRAGARLVVISSIWQERARTDKLSYTVTKAAVGGLVRSAAVDLGRDGHLVNGVLPGVLDTPMTRNNLSADQIAGVSARTTLNRLPDLASLAATVGFLCSSANNSVSGQSIVVDLGMSNAHLL